MAVVGVMYNLKGAPPEDGEPPDLGGMIGVTVRVAEALKAHGHEFR